VFRILVVSCATLAVSLSCLCGRVEAGQSRGNPQAASEVRSALQSMYAARAAAPQLRGFSLTLVQGDIKGPSTSEGVPPAVGKALADLKDFLPYKGYTLLDTAWTVGTGELKTQLRRSETVTYDVDMTIAPVLRGGPLVVSGFRVHESGAPSADGRERAELEQQTRAMRAETEALRGEVLALKSRRASTQDPRAQDTPASLRAQLEPAEARLAQLEAALVATKQSAARVAAKDAIIDTSFHMSVGETVVVGTSRIQGDKALIVLVTAVGR